MATWRNNAATSLEEAVRDLGNQNKAVALADSSREKFFDIGNSFRLYTATGEEKYKTHYINGLLELEELIKLLEKQIGEGNGETISLQSLLEKKTDETEMFVRLKLINDSLIQETIKLKNIQPISSHALKPLSPGHANVSAEKLAATEAQKSNRKLFGRIKDAIANKKPTTNQTEARAQNNASVNSNPTPTALNDLLKTSIDKLTINYELINENERRLILNNDKLLTRLSTILYELKQLQVEISSLHDQELKQTASVSLKELSKITKMIIFISIILALIILLSAWQLYKHDKMLLAARNEAIRQNHIRSDFLSHMSHEIRTPLNSILGFSEQLENSPLNGTQKEQIVALRQSSRILLSIVNDVLDLSKFETGNVNLHTTNFYPVKTIRHVVSSIQVLAAKKNLDLKCLCEMDSDFRLAGDEYRLKQVLINFINNAIKFTELGRVTIHAKVIESTLFVEIADTGRGIAKEHLEHIFDEFTQVTKANDNERHNGSGLGLAICKKIVEAQGGKINVTSVIGKGTVFSFHIPYLPFQQTLETDIQKQIKPALDTAVIASKTLLVAEDDKMNIMLISTIFKKWGIAFDMVESGRLAFESFEKNSYDMILTDIHMPDGDGISLAKLIRQYPDQIKSRVPILAITANAMQKDLDDYKSIGMNDHIVKPFSEQILFEKILKNLVSEQEVKIEV
jgi:signal transduction histidine kinase/ActR/RegA family two-component response regulator